MFFYIFRTKTISEFDYILREKSGNFKKSISHIGLLIGLKNFKISIEDLWPWFIFKRSYMTFYAFHSTIDIKPMKIHQLDCIFKVAVNKNLIRRLNHL